MTETTTVKVRALAVRSFEFSHTRADPNELLKFIAERLERMEVSASSLWYGNTASWDNYREWYVVVVE